MKAFRKQLEAIGSALLLVERLPEGTLWALSATNDDDAESMSTLNIFAPQTDWDALHKALKFKKAVDRGVTQGLLEPFVSYKQGTLLISFIQVED